MITFFLWELIGLEDIGLLLLRLAIGAIFIYHGWPKIKNAKNLSPMMGLPGGTGSVLLLGLVEFLSGFGLILGVYVKVAAILLSLVMAGAIYKKIVNWRVPFSAHDKMGWEFDLILLAANLTIFLAGSGTITVQ